MPSAEVTIYYSDDGMIFRNTYIGSVNCVFCDTQPRESSIFMIIMYHLELKSYELTECDMTIILFEILHLVNPRFLLTYGTL
jgi:hypothetical protein